MELKVNPAGTDSVTVTVPLVAAFPLLVTVTEYVAPVCPCVKFPLCDLLIASAGPATATLNACAAEASPEAVSVAVIAKLNGLPTLELGVPPIAPVEGFS